MTQRICLRAGLEDVDDYTPYMSTMQGVPTVTVRRGR